MRDIDHQLLARELAVSRRTIPSCQWSTIADAIVADRANWDRHLRKAEKLINRDLFGCLDELRTKGVVVPPLRMERRKIAAIRNHLDPLPVYRGSHIFSSDYRQRPLAEVQEDSAFGGYTADQLLRAPHLVDFFNQPAIVDFLEAALGCVPTLYSVNAWWSFPATSPTGDGMQRFHRDTDDWRFFTLFVYLTDVDEGAGPHQIVTGSHTLAGMKELIEQARAMAPGEKMIDPLESFTDDVYFRPEFSAFVERHFQNSTINVTGAAGTMFIANTIAVHRGLMPTKTPRLLVWARYGLGPNTNSIDLEQGPLARLLTATELPDTQRNRYINRLMFEFDRISGPVPEIAPGAPDAPALNAKKMPAKPDNDVPLPPLPILRPASERSGAAARRVEAAKRAEAERAEAAMSAVKPTMVSASLKWAKGLLSR